jgi:hypothetical protein
MNFGDRESFAVQFELDEEHQGAWLFGKFCYWIGGIRVGNYELGTSLRDVYIGMKWLPHDCGNRRGGILCSLTPEEAFTALDGALYANEVCTDTQYPELPDAPARFDISVAIDVFNQWKIYLIECDGVARILMRNTEDGVVRMTTLPQGVFDGVIKDVYAYLEGLYERESGGQL